MDSDQASVNVLLICHDVITNNNERQWEVRTSSEQNKIYIVGKGLRRAIQKCNFFEFEPLCQKLWAFMSNLPKPLIKYGHVT